MIDDRLEESIDRQRREIDVSGAMFRTRVFRVSELADMLDSGKLLFIGGKPFKRWTLAAKSRIIESLLLGLPPGSITIDGANPAWHIADGAELISAIYDYLNGLYRLTGTNFEWGEYNCHFDQLPLRLRSRLLNLELIATIVNPGATDIYRLSIYSASLLKIGKSSELWGCAEAIYPEDFSDLLEQASQTDATDAHRLWQSMIALFFAERFKTARFNKILQLEEMRFDIFECMMLERYEAIRTYIRLRARMVYDLMPDIANFAAAVVDDDDSTYLWTDKKSAIFTIILTLIAADRGRLPAPDFTNRFKTAWKSCLGRGAGFLYRDYARKSSAIYDYLTR